jgi:hypothetical protein
MSGVYGWWCARGCIDTRTRRDGAPDHASACYACELFVEGGRETPCSGCGAWLTELGGDGTFVVSADEAQVRRHWAESLLDAAKVAVFRERFRPRAPEPDPRAFDMAAYERWYTVMQRAYFERRAALEADPEFMAAAEAKVSPVTLEERVDQSMRGSRRYRCPKCRQFGLEYFGVPFPR